MRFASRTSAPGRAKLRWLLSLPIVWAIALAAFACGGGSEVFVGEPTGAIAFAADRDGNEEIYVMGGDGSGQTNLTNDEAVDSEPWWSPDGSRISFSSFRTGPQNIFTMAADGGDVKQLTENQAVDGGARWSPDSSRIAFYTFRSQSRQLLWVMGADGSDPQPVLEDQVPGPETSCAGGFVGGWLDNDTLLFRGSQGGIQALQICSVRQDGTDTRVLRSEEGVFSYFPALSPDGSKIAFTSNRDGNEEIYVMNVDGGRLRRVTDDPGQDEYPTWSPDGQWIAFHSDRDGDFDIYIARPNGSDLRQLTNVEGSDTQPSWSPR